MIKNKYNIYNFNFHQIHKFCIDNHKKEIVVKCTILLNTTIIYLSKKPILETL